MQGKPMVEGLTQFTKEDRRRFEKMFKDIYLGGGPNDPPIVMRLDRNETKTDRLEAIMSKLTYLVVGACISVLVQGGIKLMSVIHW